MPGHAVFDDARLSRRSLIVGAASLLALRCARQSGQDAYFSNYSLAGLIAVASKTTDPDEQCLAARLLRSRMAALGHDNIVSTGAGLGTYHRKIELFDVLAQPPSIAFACRGSPVHDAALRVLPDPVWTGRAVAFIGYLPDVHSSVDGDFLSTIGTSFVPSTALVQSRDSEVLTDWRFLSSTLEHEAEHLVRPNDRMLSSELHANIRELSTLETLRYYEPVEPVNERIAYVGGVIRNARYLQSFGNDFADVYPAVICAQALRDAKIPEYTLRRYATMKTPNDLAKMLRDAAANALQKETDEGVEKTPRRADKTTAPEKTTIGDIFDGDVVRVL